MLNALKSLMLQDSNGHSAAQRRVKAAQFPAPLATALLAPLTGAERAAVAAVESMRTRVEQDRREIVMMDHGAGSSTDQRSVEEMERGVPTTLVVGKLCKSASKPPASAELPFRLVRWQDSKSCIEMGACLGVSPSYIASALKLTGAGKLVTLEGAPALAELAAANLRDQGLTDAEVRLGNFSQTLVPTLQALRPVDFMFIDGHHDRDATLQYLTTAKPFLARSNSVVFDDID